MTTPLVSAAARPAPARRATSRTPQRHGQGGDLPAAVGRLLSTSAGETPIVAAFQSSV